jgi:hypothetical protein
MMKREQPGKNARGLTLDPRNADSIEMDRAGPKRGAHHSL